MDLNYHDYPILYVDDDVNVLTAFRLAFSEDFKVITTSNPEEALSILRGNAELSILLVDQRMPKVTGSDLLAESRKVRPELVRMMVTAYADIEAVARAINEGQVTRYIVKPWRHEDLEAILRGGIEVFHLSRRVRDLQLELFRASRQSVAAVVLEELAHEVSNPLAAVNSGVSLMHQSIREMRAARVASAAASDVDIAGRLEEMEECSTDALSALAVMNSILGRVRGRERGNQLALRLVAVDLRSLVEATTRLIPPDLGRGIRLITEFDSQLQRVRSDPTALGQILLNLLINATHALVDKPPVKPSSVQEIHLAVLRQGADLLVRVADTGCGIPLDLQERIFDANFTTRPAEKGSGLGLAISRDLARQLGGALTVKSEPGQGAVFELRLPWVPAESGA